MIRVTQLGYLGIGVSDIEKWKTYATEVLGVQMAEQTADGTVLLRIDGNSYRFALHPGGDDAISYIGWQVKDNQDLRLMEEQLKKAGVAITWGNEQDVKQRRVGGLIKFKDPNGMNTEVFYSPLLADLPFSSPRGVKEFVAGDMGLGHVVFAVDNFQQSLDFYTEVLGFRISDFIENEIGMKIGFFHCNRRHHSLAFWEGKGGKREHHFLLQVKDFDDLGITLDKCMDQGVEIKAGLGKHTNDLMISTYIMNPSGFQVEYGWNGMEVDDTTWQVKHYGIAQFWGHRGVLSTLKQ